MAITSFITVRQFARVMFAFVFLSAFMCPKGIAQGSVPLVLSSSATGPFTAATQNGATFSALWNIVISQQGDILAMDFSSGTLYQIPADGRPTITISASLGTWADSGLAIDPENNVYVANGWNGGIWKIPYDTVGRTWDYSKKILWANSTNISWFHPDPMAFNASGTMAVGIESPSNSIYMIPAGSIAPDGSGGTATQIVTGLSNRPIGLAMDSAGDIAFTLGDNGTNPPSAHVYWLPAGTVGLVSSTESNLTDISASNSISAVQNPKSQAVRAVAMDAAGDVFIADSNIGVYEVPNENGVPNPAHSFIVNTIPVQGGLALDDVRDTMVVPTTQTFTPSQGWNGIGYFAQIRFGVADFGTSPAMNKIASQANVYYNFTGSVTPASFVIAESGVQKPDFAMTGGTCTTGTAYAAGSGCLENISFTPTSVGNISAKLLMLDDKKNVLSSILLHGIGVGASVQVAPGLESTISGSLKTPSQVASDPGGDLFVADAGTGQVLMFAPGSTSGVSIGTGLTAPTGVAVDGAGDVFIADSGNVYEVPFGASGLNTAGQVLLVSGLGANLNLAADGIGNVYIADPTNGRVVKLANVGASAPSNFGHSEIMLTAGFTAPSAVAVDATGSLYVIDGTNLFELSGLQTTPTTLLNNLSGATGVAVDPSGAVYIASTTGTTRIPSISGVLVSASQTTVAPDMTSSSSVAIDRMGNVYLIKGSGGGVTVVNTNSTLALPTPADLVTPTSAAATVTNIGNAPLLVTGYTHSSSKIDTVTIADFTAADGTCVSDSTSPATGVAAGATCLVSVTFDPQPGEEGALTGQIGITSNAVNAPLTISASGNGLPLSGTAATVKATGSAEVVNTVVSVTVAPKTSGGPIPTGTVALTFPSWTVVIPTTGTNVGVPTINPVPITVPAQLDASGKATFTIAPVLAGAQTFTIGYVGDRVYGRSTGTVSTVVAKSAISAIALPQFPDASDLNLPYVIASTGNGTTPYDGTATPWQYQFIMKVNTPFGVPTGQITMYDDSSVCPPGTSASGMGTKTCILMGYSGVACPKSGGANLLTIQNAGTPTGAQAAFSTDCLWSVPQGTTYSPVIYTHYVHPEYAGDVNFLPFKGSATLFQAVRGPVVQITQTGNAASMTAAPTLTVSAGSSASIDLTITSLMGYGLLGRTGSLNNSNYPVSLSCDIPLPHAACAITYDNSIVDPNQVTAPNSVQIPCPASASATQIASGAVSCTPGHARITVYTNVAVGTTTSQTVRIATVSLAGLFGLGMIGLFFRRKSFERARRVLTVVLMLVGGALAIGLTACSTTNLSPQTQLTTPAGTYHMMITAQQVGSQVISLGNGATQTVYASENQVSLPFYVDVTVQ